ncbi:hypothetical protein WICPIJ_004688 [Wickerhamomyces pijperi]|uniref:Centromere protein H C-terminal domain-containing protein n=1 Tax=Wickerhamomyces pijperi TaxID=599730 RepID=A0A9P8Q779_WICPI|nr:hypothetical protein WICPIJ_004688 [Wickerhamomyces pijperi]
MSQDLLSATLELVNDCSLLQTAHVKPLNSTTTPTVKPILPYDPTDISNEQKQAQIFHKVQNAINKATLNTPDTTIPLRQSSKYNIETFRKLQEILTIYSNDPTMTADAELLRYIEFLLTVVKPKVEEVALTAASVTRSVHGVEGIPLKEERIKEMIGQRDLLIGQVLRKEKETYQWDTKSQSLRIENEALLKEIRVLVQNNVNQTTQRSVNNMNDDVNEDETDEEILRLQNELEKIQSRIIDLGDNIQGMLVRSGLNWAQDENLRDIVLRCTPACD